MKKIKSLFLMILIFFSYSINAQWVWQNGISNSVLMKTKFIDNNTGFVLAYTNNSELIRTTNAGNNWTVFCRIPTSVQLLSLYFINGTTGWVIGQSGNILKTTNGGVNWIYQSSGVTSVLRSVFFIDINTGWISGLNGVILKTTNSGSNWSIQASGTTNSLNSINFANSNIGSAAGSSGTIVYTSNGGVNWLSAVSNTTSQLWSVYYTNADQAWAVGENGIIRFTGDAGAFWGSTYSTGVTTPLKDVYKNIIVGDNNVALKLSGNNWIPMTNSYNLNYLSCYINDFNEIILCGKENSNERITIIKSPDNGSTWTPHSYSYYPTYYSNSFISASSGWICGTGGKILKTIDGGSTWISQTSPTTQDLKSIQFIDNANGFCVGNNGILLKTITGGSSWTQSSPVTYNLLKVCFFNISTGWITGNNGVILKTTNSGNNWVIQTSGISSPIYSVYFRNSNTGWFVSDNGILFKTTNGGTDWVWKNTGCNLQFYSVFFISDNIGWISGDNGVIYKTTDGGENWTFQTQTGQPLYDIKFVNESVGIAAGIYGTSGTVYITSNGGNSWQYDSSFSNQIRSISISFPTVWLSGTGGMIMKKLNALPTEILNTNGIIADNFALSQNYPNPFNPITKIKYQIKYSGNVILKIFNIQGKEIETLVNEKQVPGIYEMTFDGKKYSSGIYYCRLMIEGSARTCKMVLLK